MVGRRLRFASGKGDGDFVSAMVEVVSGTGKCEVVAGEEIVEMDALRVGFGRKRAQVTIQQ